MSLQVIGAGFGRTGTLSLKTALEQLGFSRCYHMFEVLDQHPEHIPVWAAAHRGEGVDFDALYQGYLATVDWPACNFWRELIEYYPQAKVILTLRDPLSWHASVLRTIYPRSVARRQSDDPKLRATGEWLNDIIWQGVFHGRAEDRDYAIDIYNRHNDAVRQALPADRLLVIEGHQQWEPLCGFLECAVPGEAYPTRNTTEDYHTRMKMKPR